MADGPTKVLLYSHHGYGKTYQCRHYEKRYGKGLIISGESGLKSIEDVSIDYAPFQIILIVIHETEHHKTF